MQKVQKVQRMSWGFNHVPPRVTILALVAAAVYVGAVIASL